MLCLLRLTTSLVKVYLDAGFGGDPVMMHDGSILDSAHLPWPSVQGHPVTISAESLVQTVNSQQSIRDQPVTESGRSRTTRTQDQLQSSLAHHPMNVTEGSIMSTEDLPRSTAQTNVPNISNSQGQRGEQQTVQYHPVTLVNPEQLSREVLEGMAQS